MTACRISSLVLSSIALVVCGCSENEFQPPPPPTVTVASPTVRDVVEHVEIPGQTKTASSVSVRARVQGILREVRFEAGTYVEEGDTLFLIDSAPFVAARDAAQAQVVNARAQVELAKTKADRIERSASDGAISEMQALEARAEAGAAEASLLVAEKELAIKQLDVDYTEIRAPISGLIERSPFGVGDLVGNTGETSLLTTIYDDSHLNIYCSVSDRVYMEAIRNGEADDEPPTVQIATEIDEGFPFKALVDYIDPTVDPDTGTLQVRARFDNPDRQLVGGLFVRVRVAVQTIEDALLVPQAAVASDQIGPHLLIVNPEGIVERRDVVLGPEDGPDRVILEGISLEDRVIVRGLLRARPGAPVNAQQAEPPA